MGLFDDLIPAEPKKAATGLFDDLVPARPAAPPAPPVRLTDEGSPQPFDTTGVDSFTDDLPSQTENSPEATRSSRLSDGLEAADRVAGGAAQEVIDAASDSFDLSKWRNERERMDALFQQAETPDVSLNPNAAGFVGDKEATIRALRNLSRGESSIPRDVFAPILENAAARLEAGEDPAIVRAEVMAAWPEEPKPTDRTGEQSPRLMGDVTQYPQAIASGAVGSVAGAVEGIGLIGRRLGAEDTGSAIQGAGSRMSEFAQGISPDPETSGFMTDVMSGTGSMGTYLVPGAAATWLTRGAGPVTRATAGIGAASTLAGPAGAADQYGRAIAAGLNEEDALRVSMYGIPAGVVQVAPVGVILRRLPVAMHGQVAGQIRHVAEAFASEFTAETAGALMQNYIEQSYNEERGVWDDTLYQGLVGGSSAALIQTLMQVATRGRGPFATSRGSQGAPPENDRERLDSPFLSEEDRASPIRNDVIDDGRRMVDAILRGEDPAISQTAPIQPSAPAGPSAAPSIDTANIPEGAVSLDTLFGEGDADADVQSEQIAQTEETQKLPGHFALEADSLGVQPNGRNNLQIADPELYELLTMAASPLGYQQEQAIDMIDRSLAIGRDDIAMEAVNRMRRQADRAKIATPGVDRDHPRYQTIQESLNQRAQEAEADAQYVLEAYQASTAGAAAPTSQEVGQQAETPQQTQEAPVDESAAPEGQPVRGIEVVDNTALQNLETDAETFQYKGGADADGVTDRLRDVRQWDSNRTGIALVYEYENGRRVVVDGHQRVGLARRLSGEGQQIDLPIRVLRQADGISEADARRIGAEKNIAEGSGTAIDAAKIFRETRMTASQLNLPRNSSMVRTGEGMAQLSDVAFGMVLNNVASERDGALVGNLVKNEAQHENILGLLARMKPSNAVEAESIIRQAESMQVAETQTSLFGEEEVSANLMVERSKVMGRVISDLGREISTFKTLNTQGETITGAGNVLDDASNQTRLAQDEAARATLLKQANTKGPISDALTNAARAVKDGTPVAKAARDFITEFRSIQDGNDSGSDAQGGSATGSPGGRAGRPQESGQGQAAQVENTPAGQQALMDGIDPITDGDRIKAEQSRPKRGGDRPADEGLFDLGSRDQEDAFSGQGPESSTTTTRDLDVAGRYWDGLINSQQRALIEETEGKPAVAGLKWAKISDDAQARLANAMPDRVFASAPKPAPKSKPDQDREQIGENSRGNPLFEDENGVRSYVDSGVRVSESVEVIPGQGISIDKDKRGRDFLTKEEQAAKSKPDQEAAPKKESAAGKPEGPLFEGARADDTSSLTLEERDRLAALRAQFRDQIKNQLNTGLDPKLVSIAAEMGSIYVKAGARRFRDLLRAMMEDLGLSFAQAQPYARNAYNQVRDDMDLNGESIDGMDSSAEVMAEVRAMIAASGKTPAKPAAPSRDMFEGNEKAAQAQGKADFEAGKTRQLPSYIDPTDSVAANAWYRGWDRANLAAPLPSDTTKPDPNPTDGQKEAGNYRMGHLSWQGLDISIETAKGQNRTGRDASGREWSVKMPADYGYIRRTEGADGDHVDIYMGPMQGSDLVVIVNQIDLKTGKFDEHKVIAGIGSTAEALRLYEAGFSDGKGKQRAGSFTTTSVEGFKAWLNAGDTSRPTTPIQPRAESTPSKTPKPQVADGVVVVPASEVDIIATFDDDMFGITSDKANGRVAIAEQDGDWFLIMPEAGWQTPMADESLTQAAIRMFNAGRTELSQDDVSNLQRGFVDDLMGGRKFKTIVEARARVRDFIGYPYQTWMAKPLEEAIEAAVVISARRIIKAGDGKSPSQIYADMVALYEAQPILNQRTSTSVEMQAYSTPAPLAYVASRLAGISSHSKVYEPTAGNGMLLIEASPTNVQANEMQQSRVDALKITTAGAKITQGDAMQHTPNAYDTFIANPPFGKVRDETGKTQVFDLTGMDANTTEIDHAIVMKGLAGLPENGRAVLLIGGQKGNDADERRSGYTKSPRIFFKKLYDNFNVTEHFTADGNLYNRQGAGWPVDVIVIDGKGKSQKPYPMAQAPVVYDNWKDIGARLDGTDSLDTRAGGNGIGDGRDGPAQRPADQTAVSVPSGRPDQPAGPVRADGAGGRNAAAGGTDRPTGGNARPVGGGRPDGGGQRDAAGAVRNAGRDVADPARADQADSGPVADGVRGDGQSGRISGDAVSRDAVTRDNTEAETSFQVQYTPRSQAVFAVGTLVPRNMQQAMSRALDRLQARISNRFPTIDTYVADALGYTLDEMLGVTGVTVDGKTTESKNGYFSAEQVDALALAIDNVEQGKGFIVGDQTGVGKGRFVAAMLRYAERKGMVPVFITKDPGLFGDMVRDMRDIGMPDAHKGAFLTDVKIRNRGAIPLSQEANDTLAAGTPKAIKNGLAHMQRTGRLPDGNTMLFTSYSQLQQVKGQNTERMAALTAVAPNAMFVLDESHEAGGAPVSDRVDPNDGKVTRAEFIRTLLAQSQAAVFSSATYAKNPTVMSLYAKTDLSLVTENISELAQLVTDGGVPLQQVMANMLVESGQYARRERSFEGVSMALEQMVTDKTMANRGAEVLRTLFNLDVDVMQDARDAFIEDKTKEGMGGVNDLSVGDSGMTSTNFASVMHNVASQFLLSIKVDAVVDQAITLVKAGEKPIIALSNTNASIMQDHAIDQGVGVGQGLSLPFNVILERYLDRLRRITVKDDSDKKVYIRMTDADLQRHGALEAFNQAKEFIRKSNLEGLPGSPIDHILDRLEVAGIAAGEITGRTITLGDNVLQKRDASPAAKKRTMNDFNAGRLDALVINRSGSTGFSMHATNQAGNDGKKRHMIILQAEPNIDLFMQMLGRIHRTGQTQLPNYTIAVSDLAVEKRPAAVLMKKLASLNANTTASKKSAVSLDNVVDFLNPYGDQVVADFLGENPDLQSMLDMSVGKEIDGLAAKFTGRLVSLPPDMVAEIYDRIERSYTDLIDALDRTGSNALEAKTLELDAKTVNRTEVVAAKDNSSPFGQAAYLENVNVKKIGRPYTPDQLQEEVDTILDGKTARAFVKDQVDALRALMPNALVSIEKRKATAEARLAAATTDKQREAAQDSINRAEVAASTVRQDLMRIEQMLDTLAPGRVGQLTFASSAGAAPKAYAAMVIGADIGKVGDTPTASTIRVKIAIADAGRELNVPLSKLMSSIGGNTWSEFPDAQRQSVMKAFAEGQSESREDRQMVTGNIPAGVKQFPTGQIVMYSDDKGSLRQGIMLPASLDAGADLRKRPVAFKSPAQVIQFIKAERGYRVVQTEDGVVSISASSDGNIAISVRSQGSRKYVLNKQITQRLGDWQARRGSGKGFRMTLVGQDAEFALGVWSDNLGTEYSTTTDRDAAREITGDTIPDIPDRSEGPRLSRAKLPGTDVTVDTRYIESINGGYFFTETLPAFNSKLEEVNAAIRQELKKLNIPMVQSAAANNIFAMGEGDTTLINGVYYQGKIIVSLALDHNRDTNFIIRHEAIHAMRSADLWGREFGLFRPAEWRALEAFAKSDADRMKEADLDYADLPENLRIEEVIANQYAAWAAGEMQVKGFVRSAFERIRDVIEAIRNALAGNGFRTHKSVFKSIAKGDIGARAEAMGQGYMGAMDPQFARRRSQQQRETDRQASALVGGEVTHGVTLRTPIDQRKESFLKAIATQPLDQAMRIPFMVLGGLDSRGRWRMGKAAHGRLSKIVTEADSGFMSPLVERVRYGMIDRYGLPKDYVERDRLRGVDEATIATEGKEHLESLLAHKMNAQEATVLQAVLTGEAVPDAAMAKLSEPIRRAIDGLGAEAVELGLISAESFERNRGQYLHRVYAKNEIDTTAMGRWAERMGANRRKKIVGNQFKGRGLFEEVAPERIFRDNEEFLGAKRGKPQKGDKVMILDLRSSTGTDALPGVDGPKGRLRRRIYWPADKPVPAKLDNYENRGTFEVRGERGGRIVLWRDFTKPERMKMGEILDARYTIGKTYAMMAQDLATGRFFRDIAQNEMWSRKDAPAEARVDTEGERNSWLKRMWVDTTVEWVKVPDTKISKSDTFRYGALAGRYVRADIWRDMQELQALQSPNFYQRLLTQWKLNKTARSPVVHMNNVMSNFILMDMADVRGTDLVAGLTAMATKSEIYREAQLAGAFGADMVTQELREKVLNPLLDELRRDMQARPGGIEARVGFLSKAMDGLTKGIKATDRAMVNAYQMEDQVFRMATYIRRRQQGAAVADAAIEARDQFLNYDIRAPWINAARRSVLPFISYTYRAAPMIAQTIAERPWKVAKYMAIYQAMNMMAYLVAPSDYEEDEERRSLRAQEQGKTWIGVDRLVRMPYLSNDNPVFLDIRRWIPAGDVFDTQGGDMPAWLHIGGPIVIGMELYLNRAAFTNQDIVNPMTDTFAERAGKRLDFLWKSFAPNAPWIPNSWYQEQIIRAFRGEAVQWGNNQPYDPVETMLSSVGIKLKPKDVEVGYMGWEMEFDRINRELSAQASSLTRQRARGLINDETLNRNMDALIRKRDRLREQMRETFPD